LLVSFDAYKNISSRISETINFDRKRSVAVTAEGDFLEKIG